MIFQGIDCQEGFKELYKDGKNYLQNYIYKPGTWYRALNSDHGTQGCSYGLHLATTKEAAPSS